MGREDNKLHCGGYIRESKHALRVPHVEEVKLGCSFENLGFCFQKVVTFENDEGSNRGGRDCGLV